MANIRINARSLRIFALVLTLALLGWIAWVLLAPTATSRYGDDIEHTPAADTPAAAPEQPSGASATAPSPRSGPTEAAGASSPSRANTHDPAWQRAYDAGLAFEDKRRAWLDRYFRRKYGDDLGALMQAPLKLGWPRLEALALQGDRLAGEALLDLGCAPRNTWQLEPADVSATLGHDLSRDEQAFFQGALTAEFETQKDRQAQCQADGIGVARMRQLVESKLGPMPAGAGAKDPMLEWSHVVDGFRLLYGQHDDTPLQDDSLDSIAARLHDAEHKPHPNDAATLAAAAEHDPHALEQYALCLKEGCNGIPALPPQERLPWSLRAARSGSGAAIDDVIHQMQAGDDPVSAEAWAGFARWLSLAGCGTLVNAGTTADAMRRAGQLAAAVPAGEQAQALVRTQELIDRYGAQARAAQGCG